MTKYKDADELSKRLNACKYPAEKTTMRQVTYNAAISDACRIVDALPTADVVEVRHGHWEKVDDNPYEYVGMCSVCRNEVKQPTCMLKPIYSYCPICGALMVKEDE